MSEDSPIYKELWEPCIEFMGLLQTFREGFNNLNYMDFLYSGMHDTLPNVDIFIREGLINYAK